MEYSFTVKVPKSRIAVIIGTKGETKKELEKDTSAVLRVDSKEGDVRIEGTDPLLTYALREVVRAIGHGHSPETAKLLLKQDFVNEIVSLHDLAKHKNQLLRVKGRVIGAEGKSRNTIESLANCYISVFGKTISIIGEAETIDVAKKAVTMLVTGSNHSTVYKFLEKQRKLRGMVF